MLVTQSCLTLCDPVDCSPPGSSVRGIFQARVLEWGAIAFSAFFCISCWKGNLIPVVSGKYVTFLWPQNQICLNKSPHSITDEASVFLHPQNFSVFFFTRLKGSGLLSPYERIQVCWSKLSLHWRASPKLLGAPQSRGICVPQIQWSEGCWSLHRSVWTVAEMLPAFSLELPRFFPILF